MPSELTAGTRPRTTPPSTPPQRDNRSECRRDDRPPRHGKKHDRAKSSKNRDRKRGPENTVAVTERSQFRSTLNQADLDRLLDGKCPWHKDATHTTRECRALSNDIIKDDDSKPLLENTCSPTVPNPRERRNNHRETFSLVVLVWKASQGLFRRGRQCALQFCDETVGKRSFP